MKKMATRLVYSVSTKSEHRILQIALGVCISVMAVDLILIIKLWMGEY